MSDEDPDAAPPGNTAVSKPDLHLEIAHVLFIDIVGYSKLSINEQRAVVDELTTIVRGSDQYQKAEAAGRLIKIPTGDGMALVFYTSQEAPAQCAIEISGALKEHPRLQVRMGVHSGPVSGVIDVNGHANLAGAGLNMAQRVMACGDAGHILVSKHVAEDLEEYEHWRPLLHDLGDCEVKHGMRVGIANLYADRSGQSATAKKVSGAEKAQRPIALGGERRRCCLRLRRSSLVSFSFCEGPVRSRGWPDKSIAVLPFENLSRDQCQRLLCHGDSGRDSYSACENRCAQSNLTKFDAAIRRAAWQSVRNCASAWCRQHPGRQRPKGWRPSAHQRSTHSRSDGRASLG